MAAKAVNETATARRTAVRASEGAVQTAAARFASVLSDVLAGRLRRDGAAVGYAAVGA